MSVWTNFRNSIETDLEPEIEQGINFLHTLETLAEGSALGDGETAAAAAIAAVGSTTGTVEQKAIAALEAFASSLLGSAVTLVKTATTASAS